MSWLDALLGRSRPIKASIDQMFGLSTANLTLQTEFNLVPTGGAGICFRPVSTGEFAELERQIADLLAASTRDSPLKWRTFKDPYGYEWIVLTGDEFENVLATVHMISRELQDAGFSEQLLASVFQYRDERGNTVYWLYNYKRGAFYPFVPAGGQSRDNPRELRLSSIMGRELAIESDLTRWYPLWGIPL